MSNSMKKEIAAMVGLTTSKVDDVSEDEIVEEIMDIVNSHRPLDASMEGAGDE